MSILAGSAGLGYLTFFHSKLGFAIFCGIGFAIICFLALFLVIIVKNFKKNISNQNIIKHEQFANEETSLEFELNISIINGIRYTSFSDGSRKNIKYIFHPRNERPFVDNEFLVFLMYIQFKQPINQDSRINQKIYGINGVLINQLFGGVGRKDFGFHFDIIEIRIPDTSSQTKGSIKIFYDNPQGKGEN